MRTNRLADFYTNAAADLAEVSGRLTNAATFLEPTEGEVARRLADRVGEALQVAAFVAAEGVAGSGELTKRDATALAKRLSEHLARARSLADLAERVGATVPAREPFFALERGEHLVRWLERAVRTMSKEARAARAARAADLVADFERRAREVAELEHEPADRYYDRVAGKWRPVSNPR